MTLKKRCVSGLLTFGVLPFAVLCFVSSQLLLETIARVVKMVAPFEGNVVLAAAALIISCALVAIAVTEVYIPLSERVYKKYVV